jgi:hypothetical protein
MLAGGVDYGERDTAVNNAGSWRTGLRVPVIYAGMWRLPKEDVAASGDAGFKVYLVDNVYPRVDELVVEPAGLSSRRF